MTAIAPPESSAEAFKRGLACLERKTYQEAASYFQTALDLERTSNQKNTNMRFLSFLGLSLNLAQVRSDEGLRMCEQAAKRDFFDAEIFCNLGIVYLRHRQRGPAFQAFRQGLILRPRHRRIMEEMDRYDRRATPVFGFLRRDHPMNVLAGRIRARCRALIDRFAPTEA
jgi:tetratricopeptide (TPR) repeat protein